MYPHLSGMYFCSNSKAEWREGEDKENQRQLLWWLFGTSNLFLSSPIQAGRVGTLGRLFLVRYWAHTARAGHTIKCKVEIESNHVQHRRPEEAHDGHLEAYAAQEIWGSGGTTLDCWYLARTLALLVPAALSADSLAGQKSRIDARFSRQLFCRSLVHFRCICVLHSSAVAGIRVYIS